MKLKLKHQQFLTDAAKAVTDVFFIIKKTFRNSLQLLQAGDVFA